MNFEYFGGIKIYRPSADSELRLRAEVEANLRANFPVGRFTDGRDINSILQREFNFYETKLTNALPKIASRDLMNFLLFQYEESCRINWLSLQGPELQRWDALGPELRRAIKYLCERVALLSPPEDPRAPLELLEGLLDECFICAEAMVSLYMLSEQTYGLFPNDTVLQIYPPGQLDLFKLDLTGTARQCMQFGERVDIHNANRRRFIPDLPLDNDPAEQGKLLNPFFLKSFGISYTDALSIIMNISQNAKPPPTGFPVPFCRLDEILDGLAQKGIDRNTAKTIFAGVTLRPNEMLAEGRVIWKPKQENRAYRRAFFEFPHRTGTHLTWSKNMVKESFIFSLVGAAFQKLPSEWLTNETRKGLAELSNRVGAWFEGVVRDNLKTAGIEGRSYEGQIGAEATALAIPKGIGQIDFVGHSQRERLLVICEDKMVEEGLEPRFFRDSLSQFVRSKDNYADRFRKKIDWAWQNREGIARALNLGSKPLEVACAMVTFYPSLASYFIQDFPCVSITELMLDYEKARKWPYTLGRRG
ncbi:MAG: hypothetical protein ABSA97_07860 [Verrucomicrobiia bacterium]